MDVVRTLSDKLLAAVWNGHAPVLPKHVDSGAVLALAAGGAIVVGTWVLVIMIALQLRSKQEVLLERPAELTRLPRRT